MIISKSPKKVIVNPYGQQKIKDYIHEIPNHEYLNVYELSDCYSLIKPVTTGHDLIRLGGLGDGGYLIPNCLSKIEKCFSPGVGYRFGFETDLSRIFNIPCFMCDSRVDRPKGLADNHTFDNTHIACTKDPNDTRIQKTLNEWVSQYSNLKEDSLLLSMDIEGFEWNVFLQEDLDFLSNFAIIVFELHFLSNLHNKRFVENVFTPVFKKLLSRFDIVHVHPNFGTDYVDLKKDTGENYFLTDCIELTLLSKNLRINDPKPSLVPNPLDHYCENVVKTHLYIR